MPLIFDSLNLMFLGAVAVFAGGIIKANPDLTKPHPDSAYGKWQAKKREKVSHEQSSRGCLRIAPLERELTMSPARVSRRDPSSLAEACRPPLTVHR